MTKRLQVGLQLGTGGLGDLSFNDSAYEGLKQARDRFDLEFQTSTWQNPMTNAATMESWVREGYDLVIAIGYGNAKPLSDVAKQYPDQPFAMIDYVAEGDNIWSATYREYEGDYVVGVMAGLVTHSQMVGFIGGGITPIVKRIESAFIQGVKSVETPIAVIADYVGEFEDPSKGEILAETQYTLGADIIYQVAGRCGLGAIETARKLNKLIISTGADHSDLAPNAVLTSRIKDVGKPIVDVIQTVSENRFEGGKSYSYGFADGGLRMAPIREPMFELITPSIQKIMHDIQLGVISGTIKVDLSKVEQQEDES